MDIKKFESLLILIIPQVVKLIVTDYKCDEISAAEMFYSSRVYESLEKEETKLWHLSPRALFEMFDEEQKIGEVNFPEEA